MGGMVHHMPRLLAPALSLGLAFGLAAPAYARMTPNPPPSGIVIHVFGPDSITSHIMSIGPTTPAPAGTQPGTAQAAGGTAATGTAATGTAPAPYPEPTMNDVLHQMFVTGDPNQENGNALAKGKAGN